MDLGLFDFYFWNNLNMETQGGGSDSRQSRGTFDTQNWLSLWGLLGPFCKSFHLFYAEVSHESLTFTSSWVQLQTLAVGAIWVHTHIHTYTHMLHILTPTLWSWGLGHGGKSQHTWPSSSYLQKKKKNHVQQPHRWIQILLSSQHK